jgi:hypothetical protein
MFSIQVEKCCTINFELTTKIKAKKNWKKKKALKYFLNERESLLKLFFKMVV